MPLIYFYLFLAKRGETDESSNTQGDLEQKTCPVQVNGNKKDSRLRTKSTSTMEVCYF